MATQSATRHIALSLLARILDKRQMLEQAFDQTEEFKALSQQNKAFTHMLVATILRRLGQIDAVLATFLEKGTADPIEAQHILRLGAAQLLFMHVSPHAAIHETVELCAKVRLGKLKGLVNAVLRRVQDQGAAKLAETSAADNIPTWLYNEWLRDYGAGEAELIAQGSLLEAPTDITVKDDDERLFYEGALEAMTMQNGSLRLKDHSYIAALPGYREGAWWVQDFAASLPAQLLGDVTGKRVLDVCAAPGGKTMQLAARGAEVTALDRSANRMKRLAENLARTTLSAKQEIADALNWAPREKFTHILIDAPCSATGTIRRHPDLLHVKGANDVAKLSALQANILAKLPQWLEVGGVAVYATCSLQKSEGEQQIDAFLETNKEFERVPITSADVSGLDKLITPQGDMRCLPHYLSAQGGMDGFFAARIKRVA